MLGWEGGIQNRFHLILGWEGGIRTPECQDQNLVPYHLATSQYSQELDENYLSIIGIRVTFRDPETS